MLAWCSRRLEEGIRFPGTRVRDGCESPCGGWKLDLDLLEEHQVLLTAEILLQSFKPNFKALKTFSYNVNLSSGKVTNGKNLEENWGSGL